MYKYDTEKEFLFTNDGQRMFLQIRDHVGRLLKDAGAVRLDKAISVATGDSWSMMACVDRMVELGELREITSNDVVGQHRVFTR